MTWGGKKSRNKIILCTIPTNRFPPFGRLACKTFPQHLGETKNKKDSHQKRQKASCTSQQIIFLTGPSSREQFNQDLSVVSLVHSGWDFYWFLKSQSTEPERFRPVVDDHLCLGVFFFRFRLKKQQHLWTEVDIKPTCGWKEASDEAKERTNMSGLLKLVC